MKRIFLVIFLLFALSIMGSSAVLAQESVPSDDEVNAIAKQLYCPVCENIPLDVCPTQACAQWRELIREKLTEGWSEEQIKAYFVEQYGDRVLGTPPARGLNWLVYVLPPLAILAGAFILYRALQSWRTPLPETPQGARENPPEETKADDYVAQLEEELRNRQDIV